MTDEKDYTFEEEIVDSLSNRGLALKVSENTLQSLFSDETIEFEEGKEDGVQVLRVWSDGDLIGELEVDNENFGEELIEVVSLPLNI